MNTSTASEITSIVGNERLNSCSTIEAGAHEKLPSRAQSPGRFETSQIEHVFSASRSISLARSRPRFTDFSASAVRYSAPLREFQGSHIASVATAVSEATLGLKKVVISDDFPEPTWLGLLLGDTYTSRMQNSAVARYYATTTKGRYPELKYTRSSITGEETVIPKREDKERYVNPTAPLPKDAGFIGLSNHTGSCGMNAGLQTLKVMLNSMRNTLPDEETQQLEARIQNKTPRLWNFLNDEIDTESDCLNLHREIAQKLAQDYWYHFHSGKGIPQQSVETGYIKGLYCTKMVRVLLHQLEAPQIYFEQSSQTVFSIGKSITHHSEQILKLCPKSSASRISVQQYINISFQKLGRTLDDPVPTVLAIDARFSRLYISQAFSPIGLLHKNGARVIYEPKSIVTRYKTDRYPHAFSLIKKDGLWYSVNDRKISAIAKIWDHHLEEYVNEHAAMIVYERIEPSNTSSSVKKIQDDTLSEAPAVTSSPLSLKLEKIEKFNELIESLATDSSDDVQYIFFGEVQLPLFLFYNEFRDKILNDDKNDSFAIHQKRKILKDYQELAKDYPELLDFQEACTAHAEASIAVHEAQTASDFKAIDFYNKAIEAKEKEITTLTTLISFYSLHQESLSSYNNLLKKEMQQRLDRSISSKFFIKGNRAEVFTDISLNAILGHINASDSSLFNAVIKEATQAQQIWNELIIFAEKTQAENPERREDFSLYLAYSKAEISSLDTTLVALASWEKLVTAPKGESHAVLLQDAVMHIREAAIAWKKTAVLFEKDQTLAPRGNMRSDFWTARANELEATMSRVGRN